MAKLYLAGPLGFSEAGRSFLYSYVVPLVEKVGWQPLDPWKLTDMQVIQKALQLPYGVEKRDAWKEVNSICGENNTKAIDDCDAIFAVLDGQDVDSGTAAEIGYGFAKGKRILGYRGDFRLAADNEGSVVNLQVEYFIRRSGGDIVSTLREVETKLIAMFETRI